MKSVIISAFVVLAMVQLMVKQGEADISCQEVDASLAACVPYLTSGSGNPSPPCCTGVANLKAMAVTTADKQAACNCVKDAAAHLPDIKEDAAASLPAKCNVQVSFPISKSTNCQNIQ